MKCGLRNNLEATAKSIKTGELMDHTLNSTANLGSVLDMDSLQELGLNPKSKVKLFTKAMHIIPAKE